MTIAALLRLDISNKLDDLRTELYKRGFKGAERTTPTWEPHTTLNKIANDVELEFLETVQAKMTDKISGVSKIHVHDFNLVNEKKENGSWVAITLFSKELLEISRRFDDVLDEFNINQTMQYKKSIAELMIEKGAVNVDIDKCIANHINLINNCYLEYADEAYELFKEIMPSQLIYDRIIIGESGKYFHVLPLN